MLPLELNFATKNICRSAACESNVTELRLAVERSRDEYVAGGIYRRCQR
jgi:hypothetical protein